MFVFLCVFNVLSIAQSVTEYQLITNLLVSDPNNLFVVADGMRVRFNNAYSAAVTSEDIIKISNFSENLASKRDNILLIVEKRPQILSNDTIFFNLANVGTKNYRFEISGANIPSGLSASIEDNYTGTSTLLNLQGTNVIDFSVTSGNASAAADRFRVVFVNSGATVTFSGKAFLQGAYSETALRMNSTLNTTGVLQANALSHPYGNLYTYSGTEMVASGFYTLHPDIVDWVYIELRNASNPSSVVASRAAFIKQDGTLVETDGVNTVITFPGVAAGNYFVAMRHRNHLSIRSAAAIDFNGGSAIYDFTTGSEKCYQNQTYTSTVQIGTIWAMRGGNANSNGNVKYNGPSNDQDQIQNIKLGGSLSVVLTNQYASEDINMDGTIKTNGPGNDQNFLLNIILAGMLGRVLIEQL